MPAAEYLELNGRAVESADTDNALATCTVGAVMNMRHYIGRIFADFSAAPAAGFKTIQIKTGTVVILNIRWNPALSMPLWLDLHWLKGDYNQAVSAELAASGTGGVLGRVKLFVSTI